MSAERTLILKLDDTQVKEAIKKLENGGLGTRSGSKSSQGTSSISKIFWGNTSVFKNLAKLSIISAAVLAIMKAVQ